MNTLSKFSLNAGGLILTSSMLMPFCLLSQNKPQKPKRPNVLFIWTDQQRASTMEVYGNKEFKVPNINKLASESVVFMNSYCTQPVSTPSRGCVMTGMYPHKHGAVENDIALFQESQCLPELLKDTTYATAYFGKWHLGDEIFAQHGFQEFDSSEDGYAKYFSREKDRNQRSGYHHFLLSKGYKPDAVEKNTFSRLFASNLPYEFTKPNWLALKAKDFLVRHKDQPFVMYVNYLEPHTPFNGPFNKLHSIDSLNLSSNLNKPLTDNDPVYLRALCRNKSDNYYLEMYQRYAGLCHSVDLSIGEILNKLDELGLTNNTIIVFTSDHGEMMGSHTLDNKSVMYEEALRIPLLIKVPWLQSSQLKIDYPTTNVNILPTLLDLLGKDSKQFSQLQGESLAPLVKGGFVKSKNIYMIWNPTQRAKSKSFKVAGITAVEMNKYSNAKFRTVITPDGWKLTLSDVDKCQLFDLKKDPGEVDNLYYTGKYNSLIKKLKVDIANWQKRTGDNCILPL